MNVNAMRYYVVRAPLSANGAAIFSHSLCQ